ncbi:ABC transporter ATP-binding protein [Halosimplex litoreum]|uniref:ABC transporter ATP-binding protein n=1 Tax=Halosimplex litoreum TaxID=1198301 RepID=A0A7T3FXX3_9EURY|nr:ABC transporter ATP-binding protein [Halosimplex litoreum]QPV62612.1 ABC transporter ATP-binding protein [Halosimplex litoreum]
MSTDQAIDSEYIEKHREELDHPLLQLFQRFGHGHRRWFVVGVLASIGSRFFSLVPPVLLGVAIDALFNEEAGFTLPYVPQSLLPTTEMGQFWFVVGGMAVAMIGQAVLIFVRSSTLNLFSHRVKHEARTATYQQMQRLDMDFFNEVQTGELISILSNDVNRLEQFLDSMMGELIQLIVLMLGTAAFLVALNPQLAAVTMVVAPLSAVFTYWYMRLAEERYADIRESVGDLNSRLENNLGGIQVIKSSNTEEYEDQRVEDHSYRYFKLDWLALRLSFVYRPGLRVLTSLSFIATFIVGGIWLIQGPPGPFSGDLTAGVLVTFLLLTQRLVNPLAQMGNIVERYEDAKASTKRILGLMSLPVRIQDRPDAVDLGDVAGRVEYDDVTFSYDGDETVLDDVDIDVEPGETVGLVGPTGAGKTTIVKLLLRLYDVDEGEVRVDGTDVRDATLASLRGSMGYVGQDNFLFDGTIAENVKYGQFDATREAVVEACKRAEAHEFIENLPEGYDTDIGERGVKLSGGQRQRVAVARTILQHPAIMIFDEATSAVDTETEMLIQRSIDELAADRTTFIIAHRLSTVRDADTILVIDDGEIVERGTHEDLLGGDGLYANLWRVQAGEIEDLPEEFVEQASERVAQQALDAAEDD